MARVCNKKYVSPEHPLGSTWLFCATTGASHLGAHQEVQRLLLEEEDCLNDPDQGLGDAFPKPVQGHQAAHKHQPAPHHKVAVQILQQSVCNCQAHDRFAGQLLQQTGRTCGAAGWQTDAALHSVKPCAAYGGGRLAAAQHAALRVDDTPGSALHSSNVGLPCAVSPLHSVQGGRVAGGHHRSTTQAVLNKGWPSHMQQTLERLGPP